MKKKIKFLFNCFCMIATCVMTVVALFTTAIDPTEQIDPFVLWQALLVSGLCAASCLIFPWDRAMKKWEIHVRTAAHYLFINLIVLGFGNWFGWYHIDSIKSVLAMVSSIAVIYAIVSGAAWRQSKQEAQRMNERLRQYRGKKQ